MLESVLKLAVPSHALLDQLVVDPLPCKLRSGAVKRHFVRDVYFDTADRALEQRGVTCRLRVDSEDRRVFTVTMREHVSGSDLVERNRYRAEVPEGDPHKLFIGESEPARILRAVVDPDRLDRTIELETQRYVRLARRGWIWGGWFEFRYDHVTARSGDLSDTFFEVDVRQLRDGNPTLPEIAKAIEAQYGLVPVVMDKLARARHLLESHEIELLERSIRSSREVAVIPFDFGRIGLRSEGGVLKIPIGNGGGEDGCRRVLREQFGTEQAQVRFLGTAPAVGTRPVLEVWLARRIPIEPDHPEAQRLEWPTLEDALALVGTHAIRDARTLAAMHVAARSDLMREHATWRPAMGRPEDDALSDNGDRRRDGVIPSRVRDPQLGPSCLNPDDPVCDQFINENLSLLAFQARVLALAEDDSLPLLERVRFLSIYSANMDELFMVQVGGLKWKVAEQRFAPASDGLTPVEELDAIAIRARELFERAQRCFRDDLGPALAERGIRILRWVDLSEEQRHRLRRHFEDEIYPLLTPLGTSPGHPFPHIPNLQITLAAMVRDPGTGMEHFGAVRVPETLPRFVQLPETTDFVASEALICANIKKLFPGLDVVRAHSFRVTRSGAIHYDEDRTPNLLQEVEEEIQKRPFGSVVRLEVERTMPQEMRELLIQEFRFESRDEPSTLGDSDVYEVDWLTDLSGLRAIADLPVPEMHFPAFNPETALDHGRSVFDVLAEGDVLLHHPYDAFETTVERFLVDSTADPSVQAIKVSVYRTGQRSRIVESLIEAAERGKQVVVLVELKARYDEERNIAWARRLEQAGIHVVYGLPGLKTHAKIALVVRRQRQGLRRYVLVGTGNLNAATARAYTDLALLSANPELGADVHDLFNALTGYSAQTDYRCILVSPAHMMRRFEELIEREIAHAQAGQGGRIRAKLNGLADEEIVCALYRASQAGVQIDLLVRGVCTLRPGVRGLSESIRVVSILGRFLEHARIFHFGNAGADEYFIGSADWRPRNLRRRVEVVTPVRDPGCTRRLDEILRTELDDPTAWELRPDGSYHRRSDVAFGAGAGAQERFMQRAAGVEKGVVASTRAE